jgi:hypothetical protein
LINVALLVGRVPFKLVDFPRVYDLIRRRKKVREIGPSFIANVVAEGDVTPGGINLNSQRDHQSITPVIPPPSLIWFK